MQPLVGPETPLTSLHALVYVTEGQGSRHDAVYRGLEFRLAYGAR